MNKPIIIIDCSYLCYRSAYALKGLSHQEVQTGVIFGFLNSLLGIAEKFKTNEFIFAFDSRRSIRKRLYPEYKNNRTEQPPEMKAIMLEMIPQRELLKNEVLKDIGFRNILYQVGYEADDVIAMVVLNFEGPFVVVSRDSDLYQLLSYCNQYDLETKVLLTKEWFEITHKLNPESWKMIKAIAGCTSDNVKGVEGFGELTARKHLLKLMKETDKKYIKIKSEESQEIIERNLKLVSLPMEGTEVIEDLEYDKLSFDKFIDVCIKYDFRSFMTTKRDQWKKFFDGNY